MPDPPREATTSGDIDPHLIDVARASVLNFAGIVASTVFGFVLVVVVTRGFTSTEVGLFFEAVALFNLSMSLAVWGADTGLVRTIPRLRVFERGRDVGSIIRTATIPVVSIALAIVAAMVLFAPQLSKLLTSGGQDRTLEPLIRASGPFLPVAAVYTLLLATMRGFGRMGPPNVIDRFGRAGSQPVLTLLALALGMGSVALIVAWAVPYAIAGVVAALWIAPMIRDLTRSRGPSAAVSSSQRAVFVEFWRFSLPRGLAGVFAVTVLWLDTLLIGALKSTEDAGIYAAATRYLTFGAFASQAVIQAIAPTMSELLTRRHTGTARSVYRAGTAWAVVVGWPVYLTLAVFAPAVLSIFGPEYAEAQHALMILALAMLVASGVGPVDIVLLMAGRSGWNLLNTFVAVTLNVTLNILLIPRLGITGAAIAWSASILANNLVPLLQVRVHLGLHPLGRETIWAAGASLVAFGVIPSALRGAFTASVPVMTFAVVVGGAVYVAFLWRLRHVLRLDRGVFTLREQDSKNAHSVGKAPSDV